MVDDGDKGRCIHGCYPVDIDILRKITRSDKLSDEFKEILDDEEVDIDKTGPVAGEEFIKQLSKHSKFANEEEPYVGANEKTNREYVIKAGEQGPALGVYMDFNSKLDNEGFDRNKVGEDLKVSPGSQLQQEIQQKHQRAQQQINQTLSGIEDLYKKKQLLEHDKRKLQAKKDHFEDEKEEALKADFVDNVDQHTGRSSIIQMQANNVFPSIIPDFYSMQSLDDLVDGHLKDLPEQEKSVLRKKWKLYQKWKEQFGSAVDNKLKVINQRLNSVKTSIEQTKEFLKPYVETVRIIQGDYEDKLDKLINENDFYIGHSNSVRFMKYIGVKDVEGGKFKDVIVVDVTHADIASPSNVQSPADGAEKVVMKWDEYLVCEHVFNEVFQPQIDERKHEVERYIKGLIGEEFFEDTLDGEDYDKSDDDYRDIRKYTNRFPNIKKPSDYQEYSLDTYNKLREFALRKLGLGADEYFVKDHENLRDGLLGPGYPTPFWINYKIDNGLNIMK